MFVSFGIYQLLHKSLYECFGLYDFHYMEAIIKYILFFVIKFI